MAAYLLVSLHFDHTRHAMVLPDDAAAFRLVATGDADRDRRLPTWMQVAQVGDVFSVRRDQYAGTNQELVRLGNVTYGDAP